jgi:hypothetical protein
MTDALSAPLQQGAERGRDSRDLRKNPVKHFLIKSELNSYIKFIINSILRKIVCVFGFFSYMLCLGLAQDGEKLGD